MRVLFGLLLLSVSVLGVTSDFVVTPIIPAGTYQWQVDGVTNPTLTLTAGNTYTFDLTNAGGNGIHPFGFNNNGDPLTVATLDNTKYTVTTVGDCGTNTATGRYIGTSCKVQLAINSAAPQGSLWYKCVNHQGMLGQLNIVAAAPSSSSSTGVMSSSSSSTGVMGSSSTGGMGSSSSSGNAMPIIMGGTITNNTFRITGNNASFGYIFTHNGNMYQNPTLNVTAGIPVTFSFEWVFSQFHPFGFSFRPNTDGVAISQDYFPDSINKVWTINSNLSCDLSTNETVRLVKLNVTTNPTMPVTSPCVVTIPGPIIIVGGPAIFYRCAKHPQMIGAININPAPAVAGSSSSSTAMSSSGTGTGMSSSSSSGSNPPPMSSSGSSSPKPGSSSTGGNSASTIAGAGLSIMIAFIAAIIMA